MRTVAQILELEKREFDNISCIDILSRIGIKVINRGNRYVAMCPIHGDQNTPSLTIYTQTNTWTCFSSKCVNLQDPSKQNGGSNINLVMQTLKLNYPETLDWLRNNFNIRDYNTVQLQKPKKTEYNITHSDVTYYHSLLQLHNKQEYFHNRGFTDKTINEQMFGYNGEGYVIPIWSGEPQKSDVLSIKVRQIDNKKMKYIRLGKYDSSLYGLWDTQNKNTIFAFAGELDCRLANQYGLPSFSLIDGAKGWNKLRPDWPTFYFPSAKNMIVVFDKKEEVTGAQMATIWENIKGRFSAKLIHYPIDFIGSDFNEFILEKGILKFYELINWCPWTQTILQT